MLVHQLGQLISVLRERQATLDLVVLLPDEQTVDLQVLVVREEAAELGVSDLLVRDQTQAEVFVLVG